MGLEPTTPGLEVRCAIRLRQADFAQGTDYMFSTRVQHEMTHFLVVFCDLDPLNSVII